LKFLIEIAAAGAGTSNRRHQPTEGSRLIRHAFIFNLTVASLVVAALPARAVDLHAYWDQRCGTCHGHAAQFARQFLTVKDGKLQGRHHVDDLVRFLPNHYLPADMVAPVTAMLLAQVTTEPRFKAQCGRCHETAAALARKSLALRNGILVNRKTGKPTSEFLNGHARLDLADVPFFVDVLTRVTREVAAR
jgi:bacterioferritin-associated ferredoxin